MNRIGIFGGAFNPIHNGHINLIDNCIKELNLDKVILIPTARPPHKTSENLASEVDRMNMLELLSSYDKRFEVSDIEFKRNETSYTYYTLLELKEKYKNDELFLIIGSDEYMIFNTWFNPKEISSMARIVSASREDGEYLKMLECKNNTPVLSDSIIINASVIEVSSSQIRDMIKQGKDISNYVPKVICDYIGEHRLYV